MKLFICFLICFYSLHVSSNTNDIGDTDLLSYLSPFSDNTGSRSLQLQGRAAKDLYTQLQREQDNDVNDNCWVRESEKGKTISCDVGHLYLMCTHFYIEVKYLKNSTCVIMNSK